MKKIILIFLGLLIPSIVLADMGGPGIYNYNIEVSNVNGTVCYKYNYDSLTNNGIIPYKTTGTIIYEIDVNGKMYGRMLYEDKDCFILLDNVINTSSDMSLDDYIGKEENIEGIILKDNLEIHSSPAESFKVVGTIPINSKVNILYEYDDGWYYVDYNGTKGWVNILNGIVGKRINNAILYEDATVTMDSNVVGTIPVNTKLEYYYSLDIYTNTYYNKTYVEYNNIKGYTTNMIGNYYENIAYLKNNIKAFDNYNNFIDYVYNNGTSYTMEIPKGSIVKTKYLATPSLSLKSGKYYMIEYDGTTLYTGLSYTGGSQNAMEFDDFKILDDVESSSAVVLRDVYLYASDNNTVKLHRGAKLTVYGKDNYSYYVKSNFFTGYISIKNSSGEDNISFETSSTTEKNNNVDAIALRDFYIYNNYYMEKPIGTIYEGAKLTILEDYGDRYYAKSSYYTGYIYSKTSSGTSNISFDVDSTVEENNTEASEEIEDTPSNIETQVDEESDTNKEKEEVQEEPDIIEIKETNSNNIFMYIGIALSISIITLIVIIIINRRRKNEDNININ